MESAVVISDTHFGLEASTLADPKKVDYLIWELWKYGRGCGEIILLGDIFDLWRASPEEALRDARYFFDRLEDMDVKISYVVGNHDHHMAIIHQEREFLERVARGDIYSVYIPNLSWSQVINGLKIDMYYPTYLSERLGRRFLFAHGHHLDGMQAISLQVVERIRRISGEEPSPADLERMMAYAYESIYRSSYIGEMVDLEERLWKVSSAVSRIKAGVFKTFKYTPVEGHYGAIRKFIKAYGSGRVDCFVYGDTHKADVYRKDGGPLAVNVGSFTCDGGVQDTYMVLSDDGIELRKLGRGEPLFSRVFP